MRVVKDNLWALTLLWGLLLYCSLLIAEDKDAAVSFRFLPKDECSAALALSSPIAQLSSSFLAIRDLFREKFQGQKKKGNILISFGRLFKKAEIPAKVEEQAPVELGLNATDFLGQRRDFLLQLVQHFSGANKNIASNASYESFVAEIQWRLFILKSLYDGRELYLIYMGPLPDNKRLEFDVHKTAFIVLDPLNRAGKKDSVYSLVPLEGNNNQAFPGLLTAHQVVEKNRSYKIVNYDEHYKYSEHFMTSNGWLIRLDTNLVVQRGWIVQATKRETNVVGALVNPYDIVGILSLASGSSSIEGVWEKLSLGKVQSNFWEDFEQRTSFQGAIKALDGNPNLLSIGFGTQLLNLSSGFSIETFHILEPEKFRLLLKDAQSFLSSIEEKRDSKPAVREVFFSLVSFLHENQGYIEGQLSMLQRTLQRGEVLKQELMQVYEKLEMVTTDYEETIRKSNVPGTELSALEEMTQTYELLKFKKDMFSSSLLSHEFMLKQIRMQLEAYREFFVNLERFVQEFPSMVLNPESGILAEELLNLRQASGKL